MQGKDAGEGGSEKKSLGLFGFLGEAYTHFKPYTGAVVAVFLALFFQAAFRLMVPLGYREIFDTAIPNEDQGYLFGILAVLTLGWVINAGASVLQDRMAASTGMHAMNDIRILMFSHLQRLSVGFFVRTNSGELMSRFSSDLTVVETAFLRAIYTFVFSSLILVGSVSALFFLEWRLALLTFASLPIALIGPRLLGARAQKRNYDHKEKEALVSETLQETIRGHAVVRVFSLQKDRMDAFRQQLDRLQVNATKAVFASALVGRTSSLSVFLVQILIMCTGGWLAINGNLSIGTLVGFVALLLNVANAANHISGTVPDLLRAATGMQRINEFLAEGPIVLDEPGATSLPRFCKEIHFQNVFFSYSGEGAAINGIDFHIRAGELVAVVGPSGCGKTTVLKLMLRFHDPSTGDIFMDGVRLRDTTKESLRSQIGVVLQESRLFNTTLRENIRTGKLDATEEEIIEAAKKAEIHELISQLPQGYDTVVGEDGERLSGGQRQRIALARAIIRNPSLLILDEATSALDPATEASINKTLHNFGSERTVLSATHRLGSVVHMDRILVIDQGRLVEQGNHEELMALGGVYQNLWNKQSGFRVSEDGSSVEVTPERLRAIPIFATALDSSLVILADALVSKSLPKDRVIFMEGDPGNRFYIIARGRVEVLIGNEESGRSVRWLEDGDYFGEMALLDGKPRNATIRTVTPVLLLSLGRRQFNELLGSESELKALIEKEAELRRGGSYASEEDESMGGGILFKL